MLRETSYAKSGDVHIAYQVVGDGPIDLVLIPGLFTHVEHQWEEPGFARFLERLASWGKQSGHIPVRIDSRRAAIGSPCSDSWATTS